MKKTFSDLQEIKALHQAGDLDTAKEGYLIFLKKNPHNPEILHLLGILSAQQENFSAATDYLKTALRYDATNANLQLHLANAQKAQGMFHEAEITLAELLKQKPDYIPAFNNLGTINFALGKLPEAIHFFQKALEKQPDFIDAYYNLGLALTKSEKFDDAIKTFQSLLILAPNHAPGRFQLGCTYMQQNKFNEAIETFFVIEKNHPHHLETLSNLGTCFLQQHDLEKAKEYYLKALDIAPLDTQILFNLGVIQMQQSNIDIAIQYYQRAIKINPDFFAAHNNLGVTFLMKQHMGFALHHFQEALRIQPTNEAIRHTVQMLSGDQRLTSSPPDYLRNLFDSYADHYEPHLLTALEYRVPTLLLDAFIKVSDAEKNSLHILDIGCGTGLSAVPFKPYAKKLTGVDLSEKMLSVAREKNIFDELATAAVEDFLKQHRTEYNLILAGDVLVYTGDLVEFFVDVKNALLPRGIFIFNTEITEKNDYIISQSGRFSHNKQYLDSLAKKNKFTVLSYERVITRMQNNEPVYGHLYVLQLMV